MLLSGSSGSTFYFLWEVGMIEWLQSHLGPAMISFLSLFSFFGEEKFIILILGILYWGYDKKLGRTMILCVLTAVTWSGMLKNIFLRRRPYFDHESIKIHRVVDSKADLYDISAQGYSFPSIHSTNAASLFGSLYEETGKRWLILPAVVFPFLVGLSRVVVGAHYPTDVLAGWAVGVFAVVMIPFLEKRIKNRTLFYGILLATGIPGLIFCKSNDYYTAFGLLAGFVAGTLVEEKYIQFENTKKPLRIIARLLGGVVIYLILNHLLKMPFSKEFLEGGSHAALMIRCLRYAVVSFVDYAIYPLAFRRDQGNCTAP